MQGDGKPSPLPPATSNWRELAEKASVEADPAKLSELVKQLCDRLDDIEQQKKKPPQSQGLGVDGSKLFHKGE